ncbi:MAG: DUF3794 domain-containing protein [Clostridiales bacterium]|nr:DUF3794 domain-containing protein [Clostridiales bacterium]
MLNATTATGAYTRKIAELKAQSIVEIKFTEQDMGEIVAVHPQVSLSSAEASSGRLNYGGRLICTVVYAEGANLCRVQKGVEFSHHVDNDNLAPAQNCDCTLSCEHTRVRREGSFYIVSVVVGASVTFSDSAERSYIQSLDGAIIRREEGKLFNAVDFSGESEVDDDFNLVATDILVPSAQPVVLNCSVHSGFVEVSGEIYLSLLAVREGSPVALDRVIPFKAELSCERAIVPSPAGCRAEIKDMTVDCKVNEERGKCDVTFNATLGFAGTFFEEEDVSFISDAFSAENELKLNFCEEQSHVCTDVKVYSERVSGLCATKAKLDYTCAFLAAALPRAEYTSTQSGVDGSVSATLFFEQGGEIRTTEVNLPFSVSLSGLNSREGGVTVAVLGMSLRQRAEGECEAEAILKIAVLDGERHTVRYLIAAEEGEKKAVNNSAISVYIPAAGDGLWETAKKLGCTPESIQQTNPELSFPLSGKERILIFRGKN